MNASNFVGLNQFIWFTGVVEDRNDPAKAGRVRVRMHALDTDSLVDMPVEDLFWAQTMLPVTASGVNGIGDSVHGLVEGSLVVGFFMDGPDMQNPVIMGAISGVPQKKPSGNVGFQDPRTDTSGAPRRIASIQSQKDGSGTKISSKSTGERYPFLIDEPDVNRLARNDSVDQTSLAQRKKVDSGVKTASGSPWSEPQTKYAAVYPYNKVHETESGHLVEMDDTPGAERILVSHRSGSFVEIHPDGSVVRKSMNDSYEITLKNRFEHVEGSEKHTTDKGMDILVNADSGSNDLNIKVGSGGSCNLTLDGGDLTATVKGSCTVDAEGSVDVKSGASITLDASSNIDIKAGGSITIMAGGVVTIDGSDIAIG